MSVELEPHAFVKQHSYELAEALNRMRDALETCRQQRNHWIAMYYEAVKCQAASVGEAFEIAMADDVVNRKVKKDG